VPYDQLNQWLSQAQVALEPKPEASGEASGKLIHYLAAGLPVACFATPNNCELLGPQGYYAKGNTAQDLAQAILSAVDDDQAARRGLAGRSRIAKRFAPSKVAGRMMESYRRLLDAADRKAATD
jgi:glycosyltransferase involved in cell wall biosynthesis